MKPYERRKARSLALQAIYEWILSENNPQTIEMQFLNESNLKNVDVGYFKILLQGVVFHVDEIDEKIKPFIKREFKNITPVELAVLRIGVFEMLYQEDVPAAVIINEALELTKQFGAADAYKFINGVLDKLGKQERT